MYEFADIDTGELARDGEGDLIEVQRVSGKSGTHHGACAAFDGLQGGIIYSQFDPAGAPETFRIYKSQLSLPLGGGILPLYFLKFGFLRSRNAEMPSLAASVQAISPNPL